MESVLPKYATPTSRVIRNLKQEVQLGFSVGVLSRGEDSLDQEVVVRTERKKWIQKLLQIKISRLDHMSEKDMRRGRE